MNGQRARVDLARPERLQHRPRHFGAHNLGVERPRLRDRSVGFLTGGLRPTPTMFTPPRGSVVETRAPVRCLALAWASPAARAARRACTAPEPAPSSGLTEALARICYTIVAPREAAMVASTGRASLSAAHVPNLDLDADRDRRVRPDRDDHRDHEARLSERVSEHVLSRAGDHRRRRDGCRSGRAIGGRGGISPPSRIAAGTACVSQSASGPSPACSSSAAMPGGRRVRSWASEATLWTIAARASSGRSAAPRRRSGPRASRP